MQWFILSITSAFLAAIYGVLVKKLVKKIDEYILAASSLLIGAFIVFFISIVNGIPKLNSTFFYAMLITSVINAAAIIFYYKSLKIGDISLVIPFMSFTPLFLIFTSYIILKEQISLYGGIGIVFIVFGAYIINFKKTKNVLRTFKEIFSNKGIFLMLCTAVFWSVSVNFYKITVLNSDALFAICSIYFFISILLFLSYFLRKKDFTKIKKAWTINIKDILLIAVILGFSDITIAIALTQQIVPYVIAIKRTSILFGVVYGAIIFKEKDFLQRIIASLIMLAGIVLITLF